MRSVYIAPPDRFTPGLKKIVESAQIALDAAERDIAQALLGAGQRNLLLHWTRMKQKVEDFRYMLRGIE
jgi:hypothetical protein